MSLELDKVTKNDNSLTVDFDCGLAVYIDWDEGSYCVSEFNWWDNDKNDYTEDEKEEIESDFDIDDYITVSEYFEED